MRELVCLPGWRQVWCWLDMLTRCKVPAICKRHDREQVREFDKVLAEATPVTLNVNVALGRSYFWTCPHFSITSNYLGARPTAFCGCEMQPVAFTRA